MAVQPTSERSDLRSSIAFDNEVPIADPPNACPGRDECIGASMTSMQIAVLEFWDRGDVRRGWQREPSWERPLADSNWLDSGRAEPPEPVSRRIARSDRARDWVQASRLGNFAAMVGLLRSFGCERPAHVAHMLDRERRWSAWRTQENALAKEHWEAFGGPSR